jgi:hypothetical protein
MSQKNHIPVTIFFTHTKYVHKIATMNNNNPNRNNNPNNYVWQRVPKHWLVWDMGRRVVPCTKHAYQIPSGLDRICAMCGKDVSNDFARVGAMACQHVHCFACMQHIVDSPLANRCAVCRHPFRTWQADVVEID